MIRRPHEPCGYCGAKVRMKYTPGGGKRSRKQHPTLYVCVQGHSTRRKNR